MELDLVALLVPGLFVAQIVCMVGLVAGGAVYAYARIQSRRRVWADLAAQTGLQFEPGTWFTSPRVTGTYRQHELTLDTFSRGTGKRRTTYTRIVVYVNNQANVYLAIYEEGVFSKIGKFFGQEGIQVGDEEIDRRFIIKCRPGTFAARLFTSISLRAKLLQARTINIEVDGRELHYEHRGTDAEPDALMFLFDLLTDLAMFVERA